MTKHGLWQFHRSLHERGAHIQWWTAEGVDPAYTRFNMITGRWLGGAFIETPYRKMDIVIRCANRYMRRFGISRNVKNWNYVCDLIGSRMKAHTNTMKAVRHSSLNARPLTLLDKAYQDEFDVPYPVRSLREIKTRLESFTHRFWAREQKKQADEEAKKRLCFICQKNENDPSSYLWQQDLVLLGLVVALQDRPFCQCCIPCYMTLSRLLVKAKQADNARLTIQRFKRKQRESTKNNVRTA